MAQPPLSVAEFAAKVKAKYPQYSDVDDYTLTTKMLEKYPEYQGQVDLKKNGSAPLGGGESGGVTPSTLPTEPPQGQSILERFPAGQAPRDEQVAPGQEGVSPEERMGIGVSEFRPTVRQVPFGEQEKFQRTAPDIAQANIGVQTQGLPQFTQAGIQPAAPTSPIQNLPTQTDFEDQAYPSIRKIGVGEPLTTQEFNSIPGAVFARRIIEGDTLTTAYLDSVIRDGLGMTEEAPTEQGVARTLPLAYGLETAPPIDYGTARAERVTASQKRVDARRAAEITMAVADQLGQVLPDLSTQITSAGQQLTQQVNQLRFDAEQALAQGRVTQEDYDKYVSELTKSYEDIINSEPFTQLARLQQTLNSTAAIAAMYNKEIDQDFGVVTFGKVVNNTLMKGVNDIFTGGVEFLDTVRDVMRDTVGMDFLSETDYSELWNPRLDVVFGFTGTLTDEELAQIENPVLKTIAEAGVGVISSLPAIATPYGIGMFSQMYGYAAEEARDKGMSSAGVLLYAGSQASAAAALERFGFRNLMTNKAVVGQIANNALRRLSLSGNKVTYAALERAITNETKSFIPTYISRVAGGFASEFETGSAQAISEGLVKTAANIVSNTEIFNEEEIGLNVQNILYQGFLEAIGGAMMSSAFGLVGRDRYNFSEMSNKQIEFLSAALKNNTDFENQFQQHLANKVALGEISQVQSALIMQRFGDLKEKINSVPEDYSANDKREVLDLVNERAKLEGVVSVLAEGTGAAYKNRLDEVNKRIAEIDGKYAGGEQAGAVEPMQQQPVPPAETKPVLTTAEEEAARQDIESRRQQELEDQKDVLNEAYQAGSTETVEQQINRKYDAEYDALGIPKISTEQQARQEVETYTAGLFSEMRTQETLDPVLATMQNAESLDDAQADNALETIFNEIDRINQDPDLSPETKKALTNQLYDIAEQIDNYEFRATTETVTVAQADATQRPRKAAYPTSTERYFDGQTATANGQAVTLSVNENGQVVAQAVAPESQIPALEQRKRDLQAKIDGEVKRERGETVAKLRQEQAQVQQQIDQLQEAPVAEQAAPIVLDIPTMGAPTIEFNEDGSFQSITYTDRDGNTLTMDGDAGLDLAIKTRMQEVGEVPEQVFQQAVTEAEQEVTVRREYIRERQTQPSETQQEQAVLEGVRDGRAQEEGGQEGTQLRPQEEEVTPSMGQQAREEVQQPVPDAAAERQRIEAERQAELDRNASQIPDTRDVYESADGQKRYEVTTFKDGSQRVREFTRNPQTNLFEVSNENLSQYTPEQVSQSTTEQKLAELGAENARNLNLTVTPRSELEQEINKRYDDMLAELPQEPKQVTEKETLDKIAGLSPIGRKFVNAINAINKVLGGKVSVKLLTTQEFIDLTGEDARGAYDKVDKIIYINIGDGTGANLTQDSVRAVYHEAIHPLLTERFGAFTGEFTKFREDLKKVIRQSFPKAQANTLLSRLDAFENLYKQDGDVVMAEEFMTELTAILTSEDIGVLGNGKFVSKLKALINNILSKLGVPFRLTTNSDVVNFINETAASLRVGQTISTKYGQKTTEQNSGTFSFSRDFVDPVFGYSFVYDKNSNRFNKLMNDGFINTSVDISQFNDVSMILHQPDGAFAGMIMKGNEILIEGKGGVYYPIKFHELNYFWASTQSAANSLSSLLNDVSTANNGKIYMGLVSSPVDKVLSSTIAANGVLDFFNSKALNKSVPIKKSDFLSAIIDSASKTNTITTATGTTKTIGLNLQLLKKDGLETNIRKIKEALGADNSTFESRKLFSESLIQNMVGVINKTPRAASMFGKFFSEGIQNKYYKQQGNVESVGYKLSSTNVKQAISDMMSEPMTKRFQEDKKSGAIYAILEVDGTVEPVKSDKHESYPTAIVAKDAKVKLHILNQATPWTDVTVDPETGTIVQPNNYKKVFPTNRGITNVVKIKTPSAIVTGQQSVNKESQQDIYTYEQAQQDEGISESRFSFSRVSTPISMQDIVKGTKSKIREYWTAKGNLPKVVFDKYLRLVGEESAVLKKIDRQRAQVERIVKKEFGQGYDKLDPAIKDLMDKALRGDMNALISLPTSVATVINDMRHQVDAMSQAAINLGMLSDDMVATFQNNMGVYLTRTYRKYKDPRWVNNVPDQVRQDAEAFLRSQYPNLTDAEIEGEINYYLTTTESIGNIFKASPLGSKNINILKNRKDIPKEIRDLLGEYTDPFINYSASMMGLAQLTARQKFLEGVKQEGLGVFLFDRPTGEYFIPIAGEGSKTMSPLNGLFTTKEIAEAFNGALNPKSTDFSGVTGSIYLGYLMANAFVKTGKTVLAIESQVRNFWSNFMFMLNNGYIFDAAAYKGLRTSFVTIKQDLLKTGDKSFEDYLLKLTTLKVVDESVNANDITQLLKDIDFQQGSWLDALNATVAAKVLKAPVKVAAKVYQASDDFFKIVAYETERQRLIDAYGTTKTMEWIETRAAEKVRTVLPTYSLVPKIIKEFRKTPLVGTFVSFPYEVLRSYFQTIRLSLNEMGTKEEAAIGRKRMAGIVLNTLLIPAASMVSQIVQGVDDDEEEALRRFLPPWSRTSDLFFMPRDKNGLPKYIDLGYSDPYNYIRKPMNAIIFGLKSEDDLDDAFIEAVGQLVAPFLTPEILAGTIMEAITNKKMDSGAQVYNPALPVSERYTEATLHILKALEPSTINTFRKIHKAYTGEVMRSGVAYDMSDVLSGIATGQRIYSIDPMYANIFKFNDAGQMFLDAKKIYNSAYYNERSTREDIEEAYNKSIESQQITYRDLKKDYDAALKLMAPTMGVSNAKRELFLMLGSAKVPGHIKAALHKGMDYIPYRQKP